MQLWMKIKKIITSPAIRNVIYNMAATALPIVVLQIVIYPVYSRMTSQEQYGDMITVISILTMLAFPIGNALNNVRLLRQNEYIDLGKQGDYKFLLTAGTTLAAAGVILVLTLMGNYGAEDIFLSALLAVLLSIRSYAVVAFIEKLDYKRVLINNAVLLIGYLFGFLLCLLWKGQWQCIYIVGYGCSILYIEKISHILSEPFSKTKLYPKTKKRMGVLASASLIGSGTSYLDKVLVNPMLGAEAVSIYYIATLAGKMLSQVIAPINNVLLAYLAKKRKDDNRLEKWTIQSSWVMMAVGFIACMAVSGPVLSFLYPDYYMQVKPYVAVNTMTAMLINGNTLLSPFLLKWCSANWQLFLNSVSIIGMILFSVVGYRIGGLYGYSMGILLNAVMKYVLQYGILKYKKSEGAV